MNDLEDLDEAELRNRYDRGDYIDSAEIRRVKRLLKKFEKDRRFQENCERASVSAALNADKRARTSTYISLLALALSIASLVWQVYSHGG